MKFAKLQATGNDFILLDARILFRPSGTEIRPPDPPQYRKDAPDAQRGTHKEDGLRWAELARAMCKRHFGVGADGLILVENSELADLKMRILNADGSEAESCGNGLRCFAKYAIERGIYPHPRHHGNEEQPESSSYTKPGRSAEPLPPVIKMTVETLSGMRRIRACMSAGKINQVEVSMGMPRFLADQIPITLSQPTSIQAQEPRGDRIQQPQPPFLNYPVEIKGQSLKLFLVSMGNPHAVSFIDAPVADFPLAELGPQVERHLLFPKRTNFEVARVLSRGEIEARVWERGVGETLACGSGACAIAVAAQLLGHVDREVDIILPGGTLSLAWDRTREVVLSGPVEEVFIGEYPTREGD